QIRPGSGGGFALLDRLLDLLLNLFEIDVEIGQDGGGNPLALANQAEQDVLGADVLVVQTRCFLPRHLQDFPHAISEVVAVHLFARLRILRPPASAARTLPAWSVTRGPR